MSLCTDQILALSSGIYQSIGSPPSQSIGLISGWLTNSGSMLGDLNNRLTTCFYLSGDAPCLAGGFGADEASIATLVYQAQYFQMAASNALLGGGLTLWTRMAEGDSTISRSDPVQVSKA